MDQRTQTLTQSSSSGKQYFFAEFHPIPRQTAALKTDNNSDERVNCMFEVESHCIHLSRMVSVILKALLLGKDRSDMSSLTAKIDRTILLARGKFEVVDNLMTYFDKTFYQLPQFRTYKQTKIYQSYDG